MGTHVPYLKPSWPGGKTPLAFLQLRPFANISKSLKGAKGRNYRESFLRWTFIAERDGNLHMTGREGPQNNSLWFFPEPISTALHSAEAGEEQPMASGEATFKQLEQLQ